jgi:hypothetical protein
MLAYWLSVGRPLVAVAVASLVLSGERVSAAGFVVRGGFSPAVAAPGALVALVSLGYAFRTGAPTAGALVAALVLLTAWLSGPPNAGVPLPGLAPDAGTDPRPPEE